MYQNNRTVILNVDDHEGARYAKTRILAHAGFEVIEAASGMEALRAVEERNPDLVLLDVKLPDINGLEVCRRIKENPASASTFVLQTSAALTGREDRVRGLEGGADNYLAAPIDAEELVANINALLRLRQVQRELLESEERFRQIAENIGDVFWIFSLSDPSLLYVSPAYETIWGRGVVSLYEDMSSWLEGVHPDDLERVSGAFRSLLQNRPYDEQYRVVHRDGAIRWVRDRGFPIRNSFDAMYRVARITTDISAKVDADARNLYLSRHDSLTRLPNRSIFHEELNKALTEAKEAGSAVGLLFLDLDRFKEINDVLGHHSGDALLQCVATRLLGCVRKSDVVARLGGDEFAIICKRLANTGDLEHLGAKLVAVLSSPFMIENHEISASASIGITVYPFDTQEPVQMLKNADMAMYAAKSSGRSTYRLYSEKLDSAARRRRAIEEGIRDALQNNAFSLHYQPQVFLDSQKVIGVEALLRWENCSIPSLACSELITVADETGLIIQIGEWVLRNACRQSKCWQQDAGLEDLRMAVNVSAKQLKHPGFFDLVEQILRETGLSPHSLELEITERVLMENNQGNIAVLQALKDKGIYISVDDFGTGFSSLSYLKHFPVDALKIDQIFVRGIPQDKHDAAIASAIIGMAHSLKMEVVAEGIECDEQSAYLRSLGCDFGQGYLFSRPVSAQELTEQLARRGWA
ncbi:MAG TPA: EAL domain-containing protein [Paucimonas sp.]|nr:EAL domain-containing protein [Paucimonas sp.]HJW55939.1 EAL domain-containing protein [Burkholderiaceae bacterium]